jgi:hypothetical protein
MTCFVILPVEVATESFATDCTSVTSLRKFQRGGLEHFR